MPVSAAKMANYNNRFERGEEEDEMEDLRGKTEVDDVLSNWSRSNEDLFRELYGNHELTVLDNTMIAWFKMGFPISGRGLTLCLDLTEWTWDFFMLITNIILSIYENNYVDVGATLVLHSISCFVLALFEYSNLLVVPGGFPRFARSPKFLIIKFIYSFLTLWKPIWYYSTYRHNQDRNRLVKQQFQLRKKLTKVEIRCILAIRRDDLERAHYKLIEVFIKNVPMALLQMYLSFKKNEDFRICTWEDANRLFMIFSCIFSSAKAATSYTNNYMAYLKPLHFLDYCRSKFQRKINLRVQSTVSTIFSFFCHIFLNSKLMFILAYLLLEILLYSRICEYSTTIASSYFLLTTPVIAVHRFYAISFFLAINRILAVVFVVALFVSNWILLEIVIPLRMTLENPPLGAPTFFSDLIDRWINVFTAHMIRFTSFSSTFVRLRKLRFRIWMGLLQLIPFLFAMLCVGITSIILKSKSDQLQEKHEDGGNGGNDRSQCGNWTLESNVGPINAIGSFVFSAHNSFNNAVVSFSEIFGSFHFVAVSVYFYIAFSALYSLYLKVFELSDEQFPVQTAFDFWRNLMQIDWKNRVKAKSFMVLTLVEDFKFQQILTQSRIRCCRGLGENYWDLLVAQILAAEPDLREKSYDDIKASFQEHQLRYEFEHFRQTCLTLSRSGNDIADLEFQRLVTKFYGDFEIQMKNMSSYRIAKTFSILGQSLQKEEGDG